MADHTPTCAAPLPVVPRTIWILWLQGRENAPELVKRCLRSWEYHNPGWTIRVLDAETLPAYIDLSGFSATPEPLAEFRR